MSGDVHRIYKSGEERRVDIMGREGDKLVGVIEEEVGK